MNLRYLLGLVMTCVVSCASAAAYAQGLTALRPLSGYECMALNLTQSQMMDPDVHVPILKGPEASAPMIGYASATVIASISSPTNGYQHVLRLDGVPGWINCRYLKPWTNPGANGQKCVPSEMSNGRPGLDFQ